jgi:hypothetical protein
VIGRRGFGQVIMSAGLGGLNPKPANAPDAPAPSPGVQPGTSPGVVTARRVVIFGAGGGMFVYSGSPGAGDLIASIVALNGQDPYGNAVFKGITSYDPGNGLFAELDSANLSISTIAGINRVALVSVITPTTGMQLSGFNGAAVSTLYLIADAAGSVVVAGVMVAQQPGAIAATPEVWHSLGTLANYTVNRGRFRLTPQGETEFDIDVTSTGANAAVTSFSVTIPAAYRPAAQRFWPMASTKAIAAGDSPPRALVSSAGVVSVVQTASVSNQLSAMQQVVLDA